MAGIRFLVAALAAAVAATQAHGQAQPATDALPAGTPVALVNPGFEATATGTLGFPPGWFGYQHAGPLSYVFELDEAAAKSGKRSFRIVNVGPEPFGTVSQSLPARELRGRTLRYTAWLKTEAAKGNRFGKGAQLRIVAMRDGSPVAHNFGRETPATGTTDWTRYEVTLAIPATADTVEVGAFLFGAGKAWLDDSTLEIVPEAR